MANIRGIPLALAVATSIGCMHTGATAMECTRPPETSLQNYQFDFEAAAAKVVAVRGPSVSVAIKSEAKGLLEKMPNSDKALVDLTLLYTLCTALRDDSTLAERDKAKLMAAYGQALRVAPAIVARKTNQTAARVPQPASPPLRTQTPTSPSVSIRDNSAPVLHGNNVGRDVTITTPGK